MRCGAARDMIRVPGATTSGFTRVLPSPSLAIVVVFAEVESVVDDRFRLKGFHEFVSARLIVERFVSIPVEP